jgi:DNA-binding transcriptional regulator LsrR (DeoR family)
VQPGDVLGLTCSRTVVAAIHALTRLPPCPVVQLSGTLAGPEMEAGSVESERRAAQVGGGKAYPVYAPMLLPDARTARALARQPTIRGALEEFEAVTVAMVAVGAWAPGLSTVWDRAEPAEREELCAAGAVGEIAGRAFDAGGRAVLGALQDRVLGIELDALRRIPRVIALVHDRRRAVAARAVLTGGLADVLVCDEGVARALLDAERVR